MQAELFPLSVEERSEKGVELSAKNLAYKELLAEKKAEMARYTGELKVLQEEIWALAKIVHQGEVWRDTSPPWELDDEER